MRRAQAAWSTEPFAELLARWHSTQAEPTMSHQLIVLPDDTAKPIVDAIAGASKALNVRMFLFTDATLLEAVVAAHKRGVKVRVMLNPARRSGESENDEARKVLSRRRHQGARQQSGVRPDAPEVDGDRRPASVSSSR